MLAIVYMLKLNFDKGRASLLGVQLLRHLREGCIITHFEALAGAIQPMHCDCTHVHANCLEYEGSRD
jgi:hypothetical protein